MKTFYTDGTGSQQTLNDSQTEKVVVYDTINDAEADLANLAEGQIIATKDEDFVNNSVPVDEVTLNNMHSVTSNAVANMFEYGELPADSGSYSSYSTGKLYYILNKITNTCYIYGKVGSNYSDPVSIGYQGYVTTLPQGYIHDSTDAMFFTGGSSGGAGAYPALFQMRVGGSNGTTNDIHIRYYDNGRQQANISSLVKVKRST